MVWVRDRLLDSHARDNVIKAHPYELEKYEKITH